MKKINWISKTVFFSSLTIYLTYLFFFPKTIILHFLEQNIRTFFVADLNLFTHIYSNINVFICYLVYAPFFYRGCFRWFNKYMPANYTPFRSFMIRRFNFLHVLVFTINHWDFSTRPIDEILSIFTKDAKRIDFNYLRLQYRGVYWDFYLSLLVVYTYLFFCLEKLKLAVNFVYSIDYQTEKVTFSIKSPTKFNFIFRVVNCYRFLTHAIIIYFFCGNGITSDIAVRTVSFIRIEAILFSIRFFFILKSYNELLNN
jgi:hypothetical protein